MSMLTVTQRIDVLFATLAGAEDHDYIGEPVSQLQHALQAAALARRSGADTPVILGALLHDIGHLIDDEAPQMAGLGTCDHERLGAAHLEGLGFRADVTELVARHVDAKRYLCATNPKYLSRLSEASLGTLAHQGGVMEPRACKDFEAHPLFREILAVRVWDEEAKAPDIAVATLEQYRDMVRAYLEGGEGHDD